MQVKGIPDTGILLASASIEVIFLLSENYDDVDRLVKSEGEIRGEKA